MMDFQTADLCDAHAAKIQVVTPLFRHFGQRKRFWGKVATVKVYEDNSLVRQTLETPGENRVLVVDGGGSLRCALLGDQLAELAIRNQWSGLLIYGCVRDAATLAQLDLGVMALASHPRKSVKKGVGDLDIPLHFAEVNVSPGHVLYADEDGILIANEQLVLTFLSSN
jgi:regulator of ribonuclease activity A